MYAKSDEELSYAIDLADLLEDQEKFTKRLHANLDRQEEWVARHRQNIITRGHETNNYAEASIRILKDIILRRTKAFNVVALVEFVSVIWEQYCQARLLSFAHNRRSHAVVTYETLCMRMKEQNADAAIQLDDTTWEVPSGSSKGTTYVVNAETGVCSCLSGRQGAFCKHQAWLHRTRQTPFPNLPAITEVERHSLAVLALGDSCPSMEFFQVI